jgi:hypothetical protein
MVDASNSKHLAAVMKVPIEILQGGGHMLSDMFPEKFSKSLIEFFASAPGFVDSKTSSS